MQSVVSEETEGAGGGGWVWRPTPEQVHASHLMHFCRRWGLRDVAELHARSTADVAWFWDAVLRELGVVFERPYTAVLDDSGGLAFPRWCVGGRMNLTVSLLDRWAGTPTDAKAAVAWEDERGVGGEWTYRQLREAVERATAGLRALGFRAGDAAAVMMPMTVEVVVAMLAVIRAGGVFVPLFSGFGAEAAATRLSDSGATWLVTADGSWRRGKLVEICPVAEAAASRVGRAVRLVVLERLGGAATVRVPGDVLTWEGLMRAGESAPGLLRAAEVVDAEAPMMLIYTSGTTGRPKGAVHTHCGFGIKAAQDLLHGFDLQADERLCWVTDMGWMMGPWLVLGTLLLGATMVLYDGAPDHPHPGRLWELVARQRVTTLGVSPTLVRAMMRSQPPPRELLASLRKFGSTGEPWNPDPWRWLFEAVGGGTRPIINYSGGTEISGGIVCGNVVTPLKPCAFAGPLPGMDADVIDEHGQSVRGAVGELVLRKPWIGQTRGFWNDRQRYLDTYFTRGPELWVHGDFARVDDDGQWYLLGRSDDTLKVAGKRVGPAEVESVLVADEAVAEAVAVGVPDDTKGEALLCLCVLRSGVAPTEALRQRLGQRVVDAMGKALAPREIRFVPALPKTRNGKLMRRVARAAVLGKPVGDTTALENPQCLATLVQRPGSSEADVR